jgi:hypothetical protein
LIFHAAMDIYIARFSSGFFVWCFLSFIHFFSGYGRDMIGVRFSFGPAISYLSVDRPTNF